MQTQICCVVRRLFWSLHLLLVFALLGGHHVEAQPSRADTVRFLEQSTFGPTAELVAQVQDIGFAAFLDAQFSAPMTAYPELEFWPQRRPPSCTGTCQRDHYTLYLLQRHFFSNALYGQDQLRQRVAFALGQILVVSAIDVRLPSWMQGYQQLLYRSAFGNFRQLLSDVTLKPAMGRFLNMLNNKCQTRTPPEVEVCRNGLSSKPNENYAREILQLFSIGTVLLHQDGTPQLDSHGHPIAPYDQHTVEEFARVLTGWLLGPALAGPADFGGVVPNYRDPMRVHRDGQGQEDYHDRGPKTLLNGMTLPAGQSQEQDLSAAIDNIINHQNVAPFISTQLIQHLITSNPSPGYVKRIAGVLQLIARLQRSYRRSCAPSSSIRKPAATSKTPLESPITASCVSRCSSSRISCVRSRQQATVCWIW